MILSQNLVAQAAMATADPWAIAGRVSVIVALCSSVLLVFVWRAILRAVFVAGLNLARTDLKDTCEDIWKDRMKIIDEAVAKSDANADQIAFLEASVKQQGAALMDSFTTAITRQTESIQTIAREVTSAVAELRAQGAETAEHVAEISGFLRNNDKWDGVEKRKRNRRAL